MSYHILLNVRNYQKKITTYQLLEKRTRPLTSYWIVLIPLPMSSIGDGFVNPSALKNNLSVRFAAGEQCLHQCVSDVCERLIKLI